jgi:hypothetical protein
MKAYSLEHQLGYMVGEIIYLKDLPTLNIDMLKTRKVINVTEMEKITFEELEAEWNRNYNSTDEINSRWNNMKSYRDSLALKYLPHTLECHIRGIDVKTIKNINEFKEGIRISLWDSDLCWYDLKNIDSIQLRNDPHALVVILKLEV